MLAAHTVLGTNHHSLLPSRPATQTQPTPHRQRYGSRDLRVCRGTFRAGEPSATLQAPAVASRHELRGDQSTLRFYRGALASKRRGERHDFQGIEMVCRHQPPQALERQGRQRSIECTRRACRLGQGTLFACRRPLRVRCLRQVKRQCVLLAYRVFLWWRQVPCLIVTRQGCVPVERSQCVAGGLARRLRSLLEGRLLRES